MTTSSSPQSCETATSSAAVSYRRGRRKSRSPTVDRPRSPSLRASEGPTAGSDSSGRFEPPGPPPAVRRRPVARLDHAGETRVRAGRDHHRPSIGPGPGEPTGRPPTPGRRTRRARACPARRACRRRRRATSRSRSGRSAGRPRRAPPARGAGRGRPRGRARPAATGASLDPAANSARSSSSAFWLPRTRLSGTTSPGLDRQDRLHVQQRAGERRGASDPPAAGEVLERVDREQEPVRSPGSARSRRRAPRRSCRARAGAGARSRASPSPPRRSACRSPARRRRGARRRRPRRPRTCRTGSRRAGARARARTSPASSS